MIDPHPTLCRSPGRPAPTLSVLALWGFAGLAALGLGPFAGAVVAQNTHPRPFEVAGLFPNNLRSSVTEGWTALDFTVTNLTIDDRTARVLVLYEGNRQVQYGRDVWVPAQTTVTSRLLIGPAAAQDRALSRDLEILVYDRSGGEDRLLLPRAEERVRSRRVPYRPRAPYTAILLDRFSLEEPSPGMLPQPEPTDDESVRLVRVFHYARQLAQEDVRLINFGSLPTLPEAYDALDHVVLASGRIAREPAALRALRRWLQQGGTVWVMLDRVETEAVAPLLGDGLDFHVVDRVSLNRFQIWPPEDAPREYERPVDFVRVVLPAGEKAKHTIDGWPVWFTRRVGRGTVVFSTLGPRGLYRPRDPGRDPASPYDRFPTLPVPVQATEDLSAVLEPPEKVEPLRVEVFQDRLAAEIGYAIIGRDTVVLVSAGFLLVGLTAGLALRRSRRRELLGWLGPVAALGATAVLIALGVASRRGSPPTLAVGQIVEALPGTEDVPVRSLVAVYQPDSGTVEVTARHGGQLRLDPVGGESRTRRFIMTDLDDRRWENLALPAGVRFGSFRSTVPVGEPIVAVARYGPEGLEGELKAGPFQGVKDLLLDSRNARRLGVRLRQDGSFLATPEEILPPGQYLAGTVLTDQQQHRQDILREALKRPLVVRTADRPTLMAWAQPLDMGLEMEPQERLIGDALLVMPLRMERSDPDTRVLIPGPLVPGERLQPVLGGAGAAGREGWTPIPQGLPTDADMHLRFRLPAEVLPLRVERARLLARFTAPSRRVTIAGRTEAGPEELYAVDSPADPIRLEVTEERFLRLDAENCLHFNVSVTTPDGQAAPASAASATSEPWKIDYLELEVAGRTAPAE